MPDYDEEYQRLLNNYSKNKSFAKRGTYMTKLSPKQEQEFQGWIFKNKIPYDTHWPPDQTKQDYDMRGYWKALQAGDSRAIQNSETLHFPDTWKTPYHESFSRESMYALPTAPYWRDNKLVDDMGNVYFEAK